MEKAQRFSAVYAGSVEGFEVTNQRLINIIRELGSVTALEVRDELSNRGRSLNRATVMRLLGNLAHEGKISAVEEQLDPRKRNKIKRYSVPEPQ
jgi:Fe2+ or Zn2+ uptake regulation protein